MARNAVLLQLGLLALGTSRSTERDSFPSLKTSLLHHRAHRRGVGEGGEGGRQGTNRKREGKGEGGKEDRNTIEGRKGGEGLKGRGRWTRYKYKRYREGGEGRDNHEKKIEARKGGREKKIEREKEEV